MCRLLRARVSFAASFAGFFTTRRLRRERDLRLPTDADPASRDRRAPGSPGVHRSGTPQTSQWMLTISSSSVTPCRSRFGQLVCEGFVQFLTDRVWG